MQYRMEDKSTTAAVVGFSILIFFLFVGMLLFILAQFAFRETTEDSRENFVASGDTQSSGQLRVLNSDTKLAALLGIGVDQLREMLDGDRVGLALEFCGHPPTFNSSDVAVCGPGLVPQEYTPETVDSAASMGKDVRHMLGVTCCVVDTDTKEMSDYHQKLHMGTNIAGSIVGDMAMGEVLEDMIDRGIKKLAGEGFEELAARMTLQSMDFISAQVSRLTARMAGDSAGKACAKAVASYSDNLIKAAAGPIGWALMVFDMASMLLDFWDPHGYNQFTAMESIRMMRDTLEVNYAANLFTSVMGMRAPFVYPWGLAFPDLVGPCYAEMFVNIEAELRKTNVEYNTAVEELGVEIEGSFSKKLADLIAELDGDSETQQTWSIADLDISAITEEVMAAVMEDKDDVMEKYAKFVPPRVRGRILYQAIAKRLAQGGAEVEGEDARGIDVVITHTGDQGNILEKTTKLTGFSIIGDDGKWEYTGQAVTNEDGEVQLDADGRAQYYPKTEVRAAADYVMFCPEMLPTDEEYFAKMKEGVIFSEIDRCIVLTEKGCEYVMAGIPDHRFYSDENPEFIPLWTKKYRQYDEDKTRKAMENEYNPLKKDSEEALFRNPRQVTRDIEEQVCEVANAENTTVTRKKTTHFALISPLSIMVGTCEGRGDRTSGDMFVGFGVNSDSYQDFIKDREVVSPSDYGVTFDKDEGVCNYTRSYCDRFRLRHTRTGDGLTDCEMYPAQELAEMLFGTTVTRTVMLGGLKADRALVMGEEGLVAGCAAMGDAFGSKGSYASLCSAPIAGARAFLHAGINVFGATLQPFEHMVGGFMEDMQNAASCYTDVHTLGGNDATKAENTLKCTTGLMMAPYNLAHNGLEGTMKALTSNPVGKPAGKAIAEVLGCQTCGTVVSEIMGGWTDDVLTPEMQQVILDATEPSLDVGARDGNIFVDSNILGATSQYSIGEDGVQATVGIGGKAGIAADINLSEDFSMEVYIADTPILESAGNAIADGVKSIFSDSRLKEDVRPLGRVYGKHRLPVYRWRWGWNPVGLRGEAVGVMATDVLRMCPEAVAVSPDNSAYLVVDYSMLT